MGDKEKTVNQLSGVPIAPNQYLLMQGNVLIVVQTLVRRRLEF
jgi:hypothetical protein